MIVRELLTRIGYTVDRKGEQRAKVSFDKLRNAATSLGLALSAGAVALGFKRAVEAASDVEETMNVVTTAFEDQTDAVLQWAKESGEAAGRSQFAMREYAATLGAVVGPTLGSAEATAEMSTNMAQLAVDLGSFFNATDDDALQALRSGLIGQSEPMLRFGVAMNVAALDAFALEQGIGKTVKQMSEAEKINLRYRFILARTTKAQGDAAKTSDSYANLVKRLEGTLHELNVALGETFLPAAVELVKVLTATAKVISGPLIRAWSLLISPLKLAGALIIGFAIGLKEAHLAAQIAFGFMVAGAAAVLFALKPLLLVQLLLIAKFLIIGALIALLVLVVEDLWLGISEGKGVLAGIVNEFLLWVDETGGVLAAIGAMFTTAVDYWAELFFGFGNATERVFFGIQAAFDGVVNAILQGMLSIVGFISDTLEPHVNDILDAMIKVVGFVSDLGLGDIAASLGLTGPESIAAPGSPLAAARGGDVNAQQEINVNVNAPGGDGPGIAAAVAPAVGRAAGDANRRTAQQLLLGGAS